MTTKIQELLKQQAEKAKQNSELSELIEISDYNNKRFTEISNIISNKIGKQVWEEYSFGNVSGKIIGILRTINFEYKYRDELCSELNLPPVLIDLYYQYGGNAPYISKSSGEIIPERLADIPKLIEIVKQSAVYLNIILSNSDIAMVNEENERLRNHFAMLKAEDTKNNGGTFTQNISVNVSQNNSDSKDNKHMQSLLDA